MNNSVLLVLVFLTLFAVAYGGWKFLGTSIATGQRLAENHCGICHDLSPLKKNKKGPYLWGIYDRSAGSVTFPYSKAFLEVVKATPFKWDKRNLDMFIMDPNQYIPGTRMGQAAPDLPFSFTGIPDAAKRRDLIAFLETLTSKAEK